MTELETKTIILQNSILNWIKNNDNSIVKLSKLSGISTATIRNTLKGRNSPNIKTAYRILSITAGSEDNAMNYLIPKKLPPAIVHFSSSK